MSDKLRFAGLAVYSDEIEMDKWDGIARPHVIKALGEWTAQLPLLWWEFEKHRGWLSVCMAANVVDQGELVFACELLCDTDRIAGVVFAQRQGGAIFLVIPVNGAIVAKLKAGGCTWACGDVLPACFRIHTLKT